MVNIQTKRLLIRELDYKDLPNHHKLISNAEVMHYIQDIKTNNLHESEENLKFSISQIEDENRQHYFLGIFEKSSKQHIGSIGLSLLPLSESKNAELGYFIHKEFWNNGYVTEAVKALIEYSFKNLGLHKISTGCVLDNKASEKVMIKLNMTKEAHKHHHICLEGKWYDRVEYGIFNPDFYKMEEDA